MSKPQKFRLARVKVLDPVDYKTVDRLGEDVRGVMWARIVKGGSCFTGATASADTFCNGLNCERPVKATDVVWVSRHGEVLHDECMESPTVHMKPGNSAFVDKPHTGRRRPLPRHRVGQRNGTKR